MTDVCDKRSTADAEVPRMEVTVIGLDGIALYQPNPDGSVRRPSDNGDGTRGDRSVEKGGGESNQLGALVPHATVSVAFSGSSANMKIASSSVCSMTGQLLVESQPIRLDRQATERDNRFWLAATWQDDCGLSSPRAQPTSQDGSGAGGKHRRRRQPHLTMDLPMRDPSIPRASLSKSNRDSKVIKDDSMVPGLDTTDTCSTTSEATDSACSASKSTPEAHSAMSWSDPLPSSNRIKKSSSHKKKKQQHTPQPESVDGRSSNASAGDLRGGSAVWSNSGAAMPEIIELFVRLQSDDASSQDHLWQGVAYLVVFGHEDDVGTHLLDLPVRRLNYADWGSLLEESNNLNHSILSLESSPERTEPRVHLTSKARLRLKVKVYPEYRKRRSQHTVPLPPSCSSSTSESYDEETSAREIVYTRSMLEGQLEPLMQKIIENEQLAVQHYQAQKRAMDITVPMDGAAAKGGDNSFCDVIWSWNRVFKTLSTLVRRCEDGTGGGAVVPTGDISVCSTIATRDSLGI